MSKTVKFIFLIAWILTCSAIIHDQPGRTIWPWTARPVPVDMQELDDAIGASEAGDIIIIEKDGSVTWKMLHD